MKRIASSSISFAALIEFAIERARFDPWIVAVVAIVTLLWNVAAQTLTLPCGLAEARPQCVRFQEIVCNFGQLS